MKLAVLHFCLIALWSVPGFSVSTSRAELEYYVAAYADHYHLPLGFVRALIGQESAWRSCAISRRGAVGLMQLMPETGHRLGIADPCDVHQNLSGGMRHLSSLLKKFDGDLRLAAAAYLAGEDVIARRGLQYSNPEVVGYVAAIRQRVGFNRRSSVSPIRPRTLP